MDEELLQIFVPTLRCGPKNIDLVSELRRDAFVDRQLSLPNRTALVYELNERIQAGREKTSAWWCWTWTGCCRERRAGP